MIKYLLCSLLTAASLFAAPKAVVFDWGDVLATPTRAGIVQFLRETLQISKEDFEQVNLEKRKAVLAGESDAVFWRNFAAKKGLVLPGDWDSAYRAAMKESAGANPGMYALVAELKAKQIPVGLLSNIEGPYIKTLREHGFYEPFEPCLLSGEIGANKPNAKAYEILLQAMPYGPEEIVFIDDKIENVEGAKRHGIDAIVFESEEQIRRELTERGLL